MARRKRGTFLNKQAPLSIKERTKRILIWSGALLGAIIVLLIATYFYLLSWLQSDSCRTFLAGMLADKTAARQVSIPENLSVSGNLVTLPSCTAQDSPFFEEISVRKMHVEIERSALLSRTLRLGNFSAEEMQLAFRLGKTTPPAKATAANSTKSVPLPPAAVSKAVSLYPSPTGSFIKNIQMRSFESHYTDTALMIGDTNFSLNGYHLIATPSVEAGANTWSLNIDNGRITTPFSWLRESGIKSANISYRDSDIQLSDCKIELAPGHLNAKGLYVRKSGLWKARIDISQANVARILNSDWRKRLTGELNGHIDMTGKANDGTWEAHGALKLRKGKLEGLPILSDLKIGNTAPYRSILLEKADCTVSYPYSEPEHGLLNAWLWDRIDVRAKGGIFLLRGRVITGTDGALSGTLSLGIPSKMLVSLGLSNTPLVNNLFNAPVEAPGYVWVRINLSGTLDAPQEDFSVRLATMLPEVTNNAVDTLGSALNNMLHSVLPIGNSQKETDADTAAPDTPPATENQKPKRPGDKVRDIINSGLDMLF